jgi:pyrroloquinoline quinone biosynthesis protein B
MRVVLLGTAAGGGVPQWNCACTHCREVRSGAASARTQDCLAVSANGASWYLLNASPDIRSQILSCPALTPGPGPRDTPLRGVLLTDGELDHTVGLFQLKEAPGLRVWSPKAVAHTLPAREAVRHYQAWDWPIAESTVDLDGLRVAVLPISAKRPKYSTMAEAGPWVVAYRVTDPVTGGSLVYAPCLADWPADFDEFCAGADSVLLDGSFYGGDEMSTATRGGVGSPAQHAMGHLPMAGAGGSLERVRRAGERSRWIYTHLNNTNPVLDTRSPEYTALRGAGAEILDDGTELIL